MPKASKQSALNADEKKFADRVKNFCMS